VTSNGREPLNSPSPEAVRIRLRPDGFERGRAVLPLKSEEGPMAVGPYRATVYRRWQGGFQRIAAQPFFVIFNAFDYAAFSVALLRSVGLVSTAATV